MSDSLVHPEIMAEMTRRGADDTVPHASKVIDVLFGTKKDVNAKIHLGEHNVFPTISATFQYLLSVPAPRKALLVAADDAEIAALRELADPLAAKTHIRISVCASEDVDSSADLVIGQPELLIAAGKSGTLKLREFGFIALPDCDALSEKFSSDTLRALKGMLLPAWERRTLAAARRMQVKAKNLAFDFSDDPEYILIEETSAKARLIRQEAYHVADDDKMRLLLGALNTAGTSAVVFCNLKSTAEEVALRLHKNGFKLDYVLGKMPDDRKLKLSSDLASGALKVIVVTDEGAEGMGKALCPFLVNFDIPLEGDKYLKRYALLDDKAEGAHILNMVCERYVYGLPEVEKVIDSKISVAQADPSMYADDASADYEFDRPKNKFGRGPGELIKEGERPISGRDFGERPERSDRDERHSNGERHSSGERQYSGGRSERPTRPERPARDERHNSGERQSTGERSTTGNQPSGERQASTERQPAEARPIRRESGPANSQQARESQPSGADRPKPPRRREDERRRDDRRRDDYHRDDAAAHASIRLRIAEATGGALDMNTLSAKPQENVQSGGSSGRTRKERGQRPPRQDRKGSERGRPENRQGAPRTKAETGGRDPYALSSEERMNMYREKYANKHRGDARKGSDRKVADRDPSDKPRASGTRPNQQARKPSRDSGSKPRDERQTRKPDQRKPDQRRPDQRKPDQRRSAEGSKERQRPQNQKPREAAKAVPAKKAGVLDKLFGFFSKGK